MILYSDISINSNPVEILSVEVTEGHKQAAARITLELSDISGVELNHPITADFGYTSSHGNIFTGYIDAITETRMPGIYRLEGRDIVKRAMEHFIVTTDLENPWSRNNIPAENLVRDLLAEAGITNYSGDATSFTFGVSCPAEFNLIAAWDAVTQVCNILAYNCYAKNGTVYFKRVTPVPAETATKTLTIGNSGNILTEEYSRSTDNLRNKVVVFGRPPIYAERSIVSPHLPSGFYKTAIVSSELIDLQSMADSSAEYNLALYNKLTESVSIEIAGDYTVRARDTVEIIEPFLSMYGDKWFVFSVSHNLSERGYITRLNLTR